MCLSSTTQTIIFEQHSNSMELTDPSHPVVSGLVRKRQDIAVEIETLRAACTASSSI